MYRRHLEKLARTRLDDVLLDEGAVDRKLVEDAQTQVDMTGVALSEVLFERDALDEWDLARIVATQYSLPFVDVSRYAIPREAEATLPNAFCRKHVVLPLDQFGDSLVIAAAEMPSGDLLNEICERTGLSPFLYVAVRRQVLEVLDDREKREKGRDGTTAGEPPKPRGQKNRKKKKPTKAAESPELAASEAPTAQRPEPDEAAAAPVLEDASALESDSAAEPDMVLVDPAGPEPDAQEPDAQERDAWLPADLPPVKMKLGSSMHDLDRGAVHEIATAAEAREVVVARPPPPRPPAPPPKPAPAPVPVAAPTPEIAELAAMEEKEAAAQPAAAREVPLEKPNAGTDGDWQSIFDIGDSNTTNSD